MRTKADIERDIAALEKPLAALKNELEQYRYSDQIAEALTKFAADLYSGKAVLLDRSREMDRFGPMKERVKVMSCINGKGIKLAELEIIP